MKLELIEDRLSPGEMVTLLRKGHVVRRADWVDDYYIRICNENGYDKKGNCVFDDDSSIYTLATDGYFYHMGTSSQPFRKPFVYKSSSGYWEDQSRAGEGLNGLFHDDWEDYGFMNKKDFDKFTKEIQEQVRINERMPTVLALLEKEIDPQVREHLQKELEELNERKNND